MPLFEIYCWYSFTLKAYVIAASHMKKQLKVARWLGYLFEKDILPMDLRHVGRVRRLRFSNNSVVNFNVSNEFDTNCVCGRGDFNWIGRFFLFHQSMFSFRFFFFNNLPQVCFVLSFMQLYIPIGHDSKLSTKSMALFELFGDIVNVPIFFIIWGDNLILELYTFNTGSSFHLFSLGQTIYCKIWISQFLHALEDCTFLMSVGHLLYTWTFISMENHWDRGGFKCRILSLVMQI